MKLKKILKEEEKEKWVEKLKSELDSENWVINDPPIFRGRMEDDKPVMKKKTTMGRDPRDTHKLVHDIVNYYHFNCYPKFPARDRVRFGTTDEDWANEFIDKGGKLYMIFPHQEATIYHREKDPVHELGDANQLLRQFEDRLKKWKEEYSDNRWTNEDLKKFANKFLKMVGDNKIDKPLLRQLGCPKKALERVSEIDVFTKSGTPLRDWHVDLKKFFEEIKLYFEKLELGYPDEVGTSDEVVWQGKYLQVEDRIYAKLLSEYPGEYS